VAVATYGRSNWVLYNNYIYSTLADVAVDSYGYSCQNYYISLPSGWVIAPDTSDSRTVIGAHYWSTEVVVVSNGYGYTSYYYYNYYYYYYYSHYNGRLWRYGALYQWGSDYMANQCNSQILITSKSPTQSMLNTQTHQ